MAVALALAVVIVSPLQWQAQQIEEGKAPIPWVRIEQLCGLLKLQRLGRLKVIRQAEVEGKKVAYTAEVTLEGAEVEVYRTEDVKANCCESAERVTTLKVGDLGAFSLQDHLAGHYWLRIKPKVGSGWEVPLHVTKAFDEPTCNKPRETRIILVDARPPRVEVLRF